MTRVKEQRATNAGSFVDEVLNEILSATDQEVLKDDEELTEASGESADQFVERAAKAAMAALGKDRFAETAAELRQSQKRDRLVTAPADSEQAKRDYLRSVKDAETKLSLAARGGTKVSKGDLNSAIEDLTELSGMQKPPRKK